MLALTQLQRVARQSVLTRRGGAAADRGPAGSDDRRRLGDPGCGLPTWSWRCPARRSGFAGSRVRPRRRGPGGVHGRGASWRRARSTRSSGRRSCRETLALWLRLLSAGAVGTAGTGRRPVAGGCPPSPPSPLGAASLPTTGWDAVRRARSPERPRAEAYLDAYFSPARRDQRRPLRRHRRRDARAGSATARDGRTVAYAAQLRHGDPSRRLPHRRPADPARGPARHPGADPGRHPGRRQRRGGGTARARAPPSRTCSRAVAAARVAGHHAADRRGRLGRRAGPRRSRQHLGHAGQLLLRHRPGARGGHPQAAPERGARRRRTSSGCARRTWWSWGWCGVSRVARSPPAISRSPPGTFGLPCQDLGHNSDIKDKIPIRRHPTRPPTTGAPSPAPRTMPVEARRPAGPYGLRSREDLP